MKVWRWRDWRVVWRAIRGDQRARFRVQSWWQINREHFQKWAPLWVSLIGLTVLLIKTL